VAKEPREIIPLEEAAVLCNRHPDTLRNWVTEYRSRHNGDSPSWVQLPRGRKRGAMVNWPMFRLFLAGDDLGPSRSRRAASVKKAPGSPRHLRGPSNERKAAFR
jgi:hypothetical protein